MLYKNNALEFKWKKLFGILVNHEIIYHYFLMAVIYWFFRLLEYVQISCFAIYKLKISYNVTTQVMDCAPVVNHLSKKVKNLGFYKRQSFRKDVIDKQLIYCTLSERLLLLKPQFLRFSEMINYRYMVHP